jgi:hypothetical protein
MAARLVGFSAETPKIAEAFTGNLLGVVGVSAVSAMDSC